MQNIPLSTFFASKRGGAWAVIGASLYLLNGASCAQNQTAVVIAVDEAPKGSVLPGAVTLRLDATLAGRTVDFSTPQRDIQFHDRGFTLGVAFPWPSDLSGGGEDPLLSVWATARDQQDCIIGVGCVLLSLGHQGSVLARPPGHVLPPFCSGDRITLQPIQPYCKSSPALLMAAPLELDQGWPDTAMPRRAPPLYLGGIGLPDTLHLTLADQPQSARPVGAQQWVVDQPSLPVLPPGPMQICVQDSEERSLFCQLGPAQAALQQVATQHAWDPEPPVPPQPLSDFLVLGQGPNPRLLVSTNGQDVALAHAGIGAAKCRSKTPPPLHVRGYVSGERVRMASAQMDPSAATEHIILHLRSSGVSAFALPDKACLSDANFRELSITPPSSAKGRDLVALRRSMETERSQLFAIAQDTSISLFSLHPTDSADAYSFLELDPASQPGNVGTPCALHAADLDGDGQDDLAALSQHDDSLWLHALLLPDTGAVQDTTVGKVADATNPKCPTTASIAAADFDRDGCIDLLVNGLNAIFFNRPCSRGTSQGLRFVRELLVPAAPATLGGKTLQAVDLNADGMPDLLWLHSDSSLQYILNTGRGVFTPPSSALSISERRFPQFSPGQPARLVLHDMNDDGMLDLVVGPVIELLLRRH